jgi:hypothetical protein
MSQKLVWRVSFIDFKQIQEAPYVIAKITHNWIVEIHCNMTIEAYVCQNH